MTLLISPLWFIAVPLSLVTVSPLIDLLLVSLFFEAILGRIPRFLAAIPILAFGAYYATYFHEALRFHQMAVAVRNATPARAIQFDPKTQSLLVHDARDAVADYELPVAYDADRYVTFNGYPAWRLLAPDQCVMVRKTRIVRGLSVLLSHGDGCLLETPGSPKGDVVTIAVLAGTVGGTGDSATRTTTIVAESDGRVIASALIGFMADRLMLFPWPVVGCFFGSAGSTCSAGLQRDFADVGHLNDAAEPTITLTAAASMLGLRRRQAGGAIPPAVGLDEVLARLPPKPE